MSLQGKKIVLCVGGGIAAYKSADLCSQLVKQGADVRVAMTAGAKRFIAPLTFEALSQHPVYASMFDDDRSYEMEHISWARWADQVIVSPATADLLARMANGLAEEPIVALYLAYTGPVLVAPAMNTQMLLHPATQQNLRVLQDRGVTVLLGEDGRLACGEHGGGRLAESYQIIQALGGTLPEQLPATGLAEAEVQPETDSLAGIKLLITSGPTHEYLDPTRFLTNPSSGKMGAALATVAARRGASVEFITGPVAPQYLPVHPAINLHHVTTAEQMLTEARLHADDCRILIFAAAVSDFRSPSPQARKIKRTGNSITLPLVENADISQVISSNKSDSQVTIGFAAETEDMGPNAEQKLVKKRLDAIVANDVSDPTIGFNSDENQVEITLADGSKIEIGRASKVRVAQGILNVAERLLASKT